jgi:uncharacterized protein (DUF2141 family)
MKISFQLIVASTALVLLICSFSPKDETYSLTVNVENLKNSSGNVQFALYNKDGSIPDEKFKNYYKIQKSEIVNGASSTTFKNIPRGLYAVNILHDENRNGKIDKGLILPKEGIGFSNYEKIGLTNRATFIKASFILNCDKKIKVKIIYL